MPSWLRKRRKKRVLKYLFFMALILLSLPWLLYLIFSGDKHIHLDGDTLSINLYNHTTKQVEKLKLEEYVVGVVAAEMPASFPLEALKAQAVAARTYAVKRLQVPDPRVKTIDRLADISSDPAINQAWISSEEMGKRWGKLGYVVNRNKIIKAVAETKNQVLVYGEEVIDPSYHASCGGYGTENSEDVWKFAIPYLRHVPCVDHEDRHKAVVQLVSLHKIDQLFETQLQSVPASKMFNSSQGIVMKEKTGTGRFKKVVLGGKTITTSEFRSKMALPSSHFELELKGANLCITTHGYGHGVGMCQYGAAELARTGKRFDEILTYYYQGVKLAGLAPGKNG